MLPRIIAFTIYILIAADAFGQSVAKRPEDGAKPYLSIFVHANPTPAEAHLIDQFRSDPNLVSVREKCHFNIYSETMAMYQQRFAAIIPANTFPCVMLQRNDGAVLYKASGQNVPTAGTDIFDQMAYYARLDPSTPKQDSIELRPMAGFTPITGDCRPGPDGTCVPYEPAVRPLPRAPQPYVMPDTEELLKPVSQPIRNAGAAIVWIVAGCVVVFLICVFSVVFLFVLYVLAKFVR